MKIAFHCNQLSIRGTEVAMYDYAHYNETLLGNKSIVLSKNPNVWPYSDELAIEKFKKRFDVIFYDNNNEIDGILNEHNVDIFYAQKAGMIDGVISNKIKSVIHAVFQYEEPHGNVYAYISEWLSKLYGNRHPFVPYMVDIPNHQENLRDQLNIPKNAIVYGRHGGFETFDIQFVKKAVIEVAKKRNDIYFLFMNTDKFSGDELKNIIYLNKTADMYEKVKFINTCNAMIHARHAGESFGLAIGEFSIKNKPIITCRHSRDNAHIDILGSNGIYYSNGDEVYDILIKHEFLDYKMLWNSYNNYLPEKVMNKFKEVFLL
jgi:hypothetical protein